MYPESWRDTSAWNRSGQLEDSSVADIRAGLPYGPISLIEAEEYARSFGVHPLTILNIAWGQSYLRPKACPEGHPLRIALNAEIAAKQRLRYQAQKHRQAVGDAQQWECRYCGRDVSDKGQSALDHIVPVANGGTSDIDNLQILCRRCNIRKGAKAPNEHLDAYMDRKVNQDRIVEKLNSVLMPISNSYVWADSSESDCPWCHSQTDVIHNQEYVNDANVFPCGNCRKMFRGGGGWIEQSDFVSEINSAVFRSWYRDDNAVEIVQAVMRDDLDQARNLIQSKVGPLQEVKKRLHTHARGECWCEYSQDAFVVVCNYIQTRPISEMREASSD